MNLPLTIDVLFVFIAGVVVVAAALIVAVGAIGAWSEKRRYRDYYHDGENTPAETPRGKKR